jgi:hypothetical protein
VFAAQHFFHLRGVDLHFERVERALEVRGDVFAVLRPFDQDAEVVDFPGEAVAELEIFGEPPLTLEGLLGFGLVVPEVGRGDLLL